jgi:hypothetical protein
MTGITALTHARVIDCTGRPPAAVIDSGRRVRSGAALGCHGHRLDLRLFQSSAENLLLIVKAGAVVKSLLG